MVDASTSALSNLKWSKPTVSMVTTESMIEQNGDLLRKEWSNYMADYTNFSNANPVKFWLDHAKVIFDKISILYIYFRLIR